MKLIVSLLSQWAGGQTVGVGFHPGKRANHVSMPQETSKSYPEPGHKTPRRSHQESISRRYRERFRAFSWNGPPTRPRNASDIKPGNSSRGGSKTPRERILEYHGPSCPSTTQGQLNSGSEKVRVRWENLQKGLSRYKIKHIISKNPGRDNLQRYHRIQKFTESSEDKDNLFHQLKDKEKSSENIARGDIPKLYKKQRTNKGDTHKNALNFRLSKTLWLWRQKHLFSYSRTLVRSNHYFLINPIKNTIRGNWEFCCSLRISQRFVLWRNP